MPRIPPKEEEGKESRGRQCELLILGPWTSTSAQKTEKKLHSPYMAFIGFVDDKEIEDSYHNITILDILARKTEMEKEGAMPMGLAACFSHVIELLRSNPKVFYDCKIILQGEGQCVEITPVVFDGIRIFWYDQYKHVVQEDQEC